MKVKHIKNNKQFRKSFTSLKLNDKNKSRNLKKENKGVKFNDKNDVISSCYEKHEEIDNFTLVNAVNLKPKPIISRVLPHWLLNPVNIKKELNATKKSIENSCPALDPQLIKLLNKEKITYLFPVQQIIIPKILSGATGVEKRFRPRDICVATPTGSGKTLSYVLPILQAIGKVQIPTIQAIVILPVIELAKQVHKVFKTYAVPFNIKIGEAYGHQSLIQEQNILVTKVNHEYICKVDIIVATPQKLLDHFARTPGLDFSEVRFLVLDEADKMFLGNTSEMIRRIQDFLENLKSAVPNLGLPPFFPQNLPFVSLSKGLKCKELEDNLCHEPKHLPPKFNVPIQRLLFSATLSHDPQQLQTVSLYQPLLVTVESDEQKINAEPNSFGSRQLLPVIRPSELIEEYVTLDVSIKPVVLHYLLMNLQGKDPKFKSIVFTNSRETGAKLAIVLKSLAKKKYSVIDFSSKSKVIMDKNLKKFQRKNINVLVASNVVARGIDISCVDCVVSYDVPSDSTYIHRIGRTARAGKTGRAISLVCHHEKKLFSTVIGKKLSEINKIIISKSKLHELEQEYRSALEILSNRVQDSKDKKYRKKIPTNIERRKSGKKSK